MRRETKKPLYRKHNKLARGFRCKSPSYEYRWVRNTNNPDERMKNTREGYDYTPLYKFLLSKIGNEWNIVYSEAVSRLDKQEPIWYLVDLDYDSDVSVISRLTGEEISYTYVGEASIYSLLTVRDGILVKANEDAELPKPTCTCCTHSFNGNVLK